MHLFIHVIYIRSLNTSVQKSFNVVVDWRHALYVGNGNVEFKVTWSQYPGARPRIVTLNLDSKIARCSCHVSRHILSTCS